MAKLICAGRQAGSFSEAFSCDLGRRSVVGPGLNWEPEFLSLDALEALFFQF